MAIPDLVVMGAEIKSVISPETVEKVPFLHFCEMRM
jgi:hypothetical protein